MKERMFWGLLASLAIYFFFTYQRLEHIAADIKVIRAICTQQPQERNSCDTIVEYKVFYPAGSLRVSGSVNGNDTALTIYYSK